jgi:hypothetical protein
MGETKGEKMFIATVEGEPKQWITMEYALTDVLARGLGKLWTLEKVEDE